MNKPDWRDILDATLSDDDRRQLAEDTAVTTDAQEAEPRQSGALNIVVERKGRAGKTATIVCGFTVSEARLKEIATGLRQALGCGGSARESEILLQGDCREAAARLLRDRGFKVKA